VCGPFSVESIGRAFHPLTKRHLHLIGLFVNTADGFRRGLGVELLIASGPVDTRLPALGFR